MSENITAEEMRKGTQPSRQQLIMGTPIEAVLAKESWDDVDVEILVMHKHLLDEETLAKLGIVTPKVKTPEEVTAQTAEIKQDAVTAEAMAAQKAAQEAAAEAQREAEAKAAEEAAKTPAPETTGGNTDVVEGSKSDDAAPVVDNKTE